VNAQQADGNGGGPVRELLSELPTDQLKEELQAFLAAVARRAVSGAAGQAGSAAERLTEYAARGGGPAAEAVSGAVKDAAKGKSPLRALAKGGMSMVTGAVTKPFGGGGGGGGGGDGENLKVTNIVEDIDVGLPRNVTYDLWTQFEDFPTFMKKVEKVDQESDEELNWTAQVFFSHRTWRSTIIEQVPDERVVWRSEADKGFVDGAVTFHSITPDLTRILVVLEYNPRGFFEGTGNLWRAQGRRVRLELKHFRRHAMTQALLHPDEADGWRGEIRDEEVVRSGEAGDEAEQGRDDGRDRRGQAEGGDADEDEADYEDDDYEDEYEDDEGEEEDEEEDEDEDSRPGRDFEPAGGHRGNGGDDDRDRDEDRDRDDDRDRGNGRARGNGRDRARSRGRVASRGR
jgi:uncharacterized membrane protein